MEICYEAIWKDPPHMFFSTNGTSPPGHVAPSCCTPVLTTRGDGGGSGASGHGGGADLRCVRGVVGRGGELGRRPALRKRAARAQVPVGPRRKQGERGVGHGRGPAC